MTTFSLNEELNGVEIKFDSRPNEEVLKGLHDNHFRWHRQKKIWYAKNTEERVAFAESLGELTETKEKQKPDKPSDILGVKVGDLFYASWGYEQTNINFFQVIALKGKKSCLLREVSPEVEKEEFAGNGMAADISYKNTSEILPPASHPSFIKDNKNGDLRRIKASGNGKAVINVGKPGHYQTTAYKYNGETLYKSWYY